MVLKVAIPGKIQFKMVHKDTRFLMNSQGDIHYIGGAEVLPPPLESEKENEIISDLGSRNPVPYPVPGCTWKKRHRPEVQ